MGARTGRRVKNDHFHYRHQIIEEDRSPLETSGSGVTVDNQSDPPASVTTLVVPGATLDDGTADLSSITGLQQVRLLGPYRVNHDDAGMEPNGTGRVIGDDLPVGAVVNVFLAMIEAWNNTADETADGRLRVDFWWGNAGGVGVPGRLGEMAVQSLVSVGYGEDTSSSGYPVQSMATTGDSLTQMPLPYVVISSGVKLLARILGTNPGTPTQGKADVYALVTEPAS